MFCLQTVVIRSMECNVANMYEARRKLTASDADSGIDSTVTANTLTAASTNLPVYSRPGSSSVAANKLYCVNNVVTLI